MSHIHPVSALLRLQLLSAVLYMHERTCGPVRISWTVAVGVSENGIYHPFMAV